MRFLFFLLLAPAFLCAQLNPAFIAKSDVQYNRVEYKGDGLFGFESGDKFGYLDKTGKVVIPATYSYSANGSYIPYFYNGFISLKKDGKTGVIDKTGKEIIPFIYETVIVRSNVKNNFSASKKENGKTYYGLLTTQNKVVIPFEYDDFLVDSNLVAVKKDGKWGLFDISGKQLIPATFTSLTLYAKDKVLRAEKDNQYGFVDLTGKWLFEKTKSVFTLYGCSSGMVTCRVNGKYGYLDLKGNEVIVTKYDDAFSFESTGLAKVAKKAAGALLSAYKYGYIDKTGKEVIPPIYETLGIFTNGLVYAKDPETNRYGFLDKTGKWAIKAIYLEVNNFDNKGGAWVKMTDAQFHYIDKTGKDLGVLEDKGTVFRNFGTDGYAVYENSEIIYALIDKTGTVVKKIDDCDAVYNFSDGVAGYKCKSNNKYGFVDMNGNKIMPCSYDGFTGFIDGISRIEDKSGGKTKYGYITNKGAVILPAVYESMQYFRDGWGLVKKDGNYFFVDKSGNLKEPPRKYDELVEFRSGYALGKIKGTGSNPHTYYYINTQLKEEFSLTAFEAYLFWENVAVVSRDNKNYELLNKKGEVFKTLNGVETLKFCVDGMLAVKQEGKWGFINDKGDFIVKAKYDSCESFRYGYGRIRSGGKWGIIDKSGTEIIEPGYNNILPGENGVFVFFDTNWGVMDKTGKILVPSSLYTITLFEKDRALARLGKSFTLLKSPLLK